MNRFVLIKMGWMVKKNVDKEAKIEIACGNNLGERFAEFWV
jgi:hypothetical protein